MSKQWNKLDKIIQKLRFAAVTKDIQNHAIICDLGCGVEGELLKSLENKISKGYGFDRKTTNLYKDNIILQKIDNLEKGIPLESQSVDIVTALAVLEHISNPIELLTECHRILKHDGKLLLTIPTPTAKPVLEFLAFRLHIISEKEIQDHKHYYTVTELQHMLKKLGFLDIKISTFEFGMNYKCLAKK